MAGTAADTARFAVVETISVLAGAVIGTLATALFGWLFLSVGFAAIAASPGFYILGIVTVALFALFYAKLPGTPATLLSLAVGVALPVVIVRFAFDRTDTFGTLVTLELVFALVALSVYRFVHASGLVRRAAADAADRT
ncbi:hypothetical protein [Aureimonas sp. AU20]|uniref:hypothetical protein n=1 Tax=Aureimonas sp. AU20 TaxID=1349819 RepID=UPI00071F5771|nr:hypothetical protein [Aureimonas sp. AU20]ALN71730.1 hypothetical protein M673_03335 [Aureimonas sp. AU20]